MNFGAEFAAEIFVRQALQDGKQVLLPKVNRETKQLDLYRVTDLAQDVAPGRWDIREPISERCEKVTDLTPGRFCIIAGCGIWAGWCAARVTAAAFTTSCWPVCPTSPPWSQLLMHYR
jgi:hypothetical protein